MSITLDIGAGPVALQSRSLIVGVQIGDPIAEGFSNIVISQAGDNQAQVDYDYLGPATTHYWRFKSNYAGEGKDVFGGFTRIDTHAPEGLLPVHHTVLSNTNLVIGTEYTAMGYADDGTTQIPTGNDVVTSSALEITGGSVPAPTVINPALIEVVQNTTSGTAISTLDSDVPDAIFSEGTPDDNLTTLAASGSLALSADASTLGDFTLKAIATTAGGAYNQDVTIRVIASGGGSGTNVSTASELTAALNAAVSGDTITCAAGNYGAFTITKVFTNFVTIESANPASPAVFTSLVVNNSAYLRFDGIHVSSNSNGSSSSKVLGITNSNHIDVINSEINGLVDGTYTGHYGLYANGCSDIVYANNYIHDCNNGIVAFGVATMTVTECLVDYVGSDFYKYGGLSNLIMDNCTGGGHLFPGTDTHADFVQCQGAITTGTFRGNLYLAQNNERAQGIFMGGTSAHTNILIENNLIVSGKFNAISVNDLSSGITVRKNTVLSIPNLGHTSAAISVPSGSTVTDNIRSATSGSLSGSNVVAQWDDTGDVYHYDTLYTNADAGLGMTIANFGIIASSLAETKGAFERILELQA